MDASRIRSLLFVPGDSPRKLAKAPRSSADALIVDWEDAVAERNKDAAPAATKAAMPALLGGGGIILVRINASDPDRASAECRAVAELEPHGVVIPGCESASAVRDLLARLPRGIAVFPLIESPLGVLRAADIAASSADVGALMFGAEDYSAETRIMRSGGEPELAYARSTVVNSARAARCEVFDSPPMQYQDRDAVRESAWRARRMGFTGQATIHPNQVGIVNEVFTPSDEEIATARAVLERYRVRGGGVYGVAGSLEDKPAIRDARKVLARLV